MTWPRSSWPSASKSTKRYVPTARDNRRRRFSSRARPTPPLPMPHVGIRAIDCIRPDGVTIDTIAMNPADWLSSALMAELLDGWTTQRKPGVDSRYARLKTTQSDKSALADFGRFVDNHNHASEPRSLRLASLPLEVVSDWEADLAARFLVDDSGERKVRTSRT